MAKEDNKTAYLLSKMGGREYQEQRAPSHAKSSRTHAIERVQIGTWYCWEGITEQAGSFGIMLEANCQWVINGGPESWQ
jgi:hypothetical protein